LMVCGKKSRFFRYAFGVGLQYFQGVIRHGCGLTPLVGDPAHAGERAPRKVR